MKFMTFVMFDTAKTAEVAQAGDKTANTPGVNVLAQYALQGIAFPHTIPPNAMVVVTINEAESNEAMAAANYPVVLSGATIWSVPILEMPVSGAAEAEQKLRG